MNKSKESLNKPVTLGVLLEYTDDFLIPKISDLVKEEIKPVEKRLDNVEKRLDGVEKRLENVEKRLDGVEKRLENVEKRFDGTEKKVNAVEYNLKVYIDDKLADYTSDIFKRLDKKYQMEKEFKIKVVELLKRHKIGTVKEVAFLEGLAAGS